jgi:hypothetical protein
MARVSAIACGYKDAVDLDRLRHNPLMKIAVGRCPISGAAGLAVDDQSAGECAEQNGGGAAVRRLDQAGTTVKPGKQEILDIDDTLCAAHGGQQLAFWNAHHDQRGFASMHIYHVASGTPVVTILRPARTPKGPEVRTVIKHVTRRIANTPIIARKPIGARPRFGRFGEAGRSMAMTTRPSIEGAGHRGAHRPRGRAKGRLVR